MRVSFRPKCSDHEDKVFLVGSFSEFHSLLDFLSHFLSEESLVSDDLFRRYLPSEKDFVGYVKSVLECAGL